MTSGVNSVREWWKVLSTDTTSIAEAIATTELCQIRGRVRPPQSDSALVSPLRNRECVAYAYSISKVVQDSGRSSIDSGTDHSSFIVSDGTADILVTPDEGSLSLSMTAERPTSKREITERTADERLDFEPSADTSDIGDLTVPIELSEGTISTGEKVTVLGKADPVPEKAATDADAVMTSERDYVAVMNDDPGTTALKKAARGGFLLIVGSLFNGFAVLVFTTAVSQIV